MKRVSLVVGALVGGLTTLALTALFYLGAQLARLPFVAFDLFDWLARVLPGDVVTLGIDTIVNVIIALNLGSTSETAKLIEQAMAIVLFVVAGIVAGIVITALVNGSRQPGEWLGAGVGLLTFVALAAVELSLGVDNPALTLFWIVFLTLAWGWFTGGTIERLAREIETDSERRRALLQMGGSSIAIALAAWGVGRWLSAEPADTGAGESLAAIAPEADMAETETPASALEGRIEPAPGTRPEITPEGEFYRIDINTRPPVIEQAEWQLEVSGLFSNPRNLSLQDLMAFPAVTQTITLSCISNRIGGDLISTARWTGARLRDVLQELGLQPEAQELFIESEDGFYESVAMADMLDARTLLVYGMNGETLPTRHGFPLRIYIPNRYGMKQPKWIQRIEAIGMEGPGYWVERGWSEEARPHIISIIDTVAEETAEDGRVPVGGIAWAGDRGIQKVEVQVDDGQWAEATLRTPPQSTLAWVQWRYGWPAVSGRHTFRVRATDGTGMLQIEEETGVRPDGATGYHEVMARV
ncbi:MAG TPA: molybdopterin-dependent oxidoreductase [Anaerolineae bacterium]